MVALVRGVHGLKGAVRVEALTDRPGERFAEGRRLYREGREDSLTIVEAAPDGPGWRLRFAEVRDRNGADGLRGAYLEAVVEAGEELAPGEFYWHEVIGAVVRDLAGAEIGSVVEVYRSGGTDVYVVRGERYGEFDVPGVRDFVPAFDPGSGEIVVDVDALGLQPPPVRVIRPPRTPRRRRGDPVVPAEPVEPLATIEPAEPAESVESA